MSNPFGGFVRLSDPAGIALAGTEAHPITGIALTGTLTGALTITGVTQLSGAAQPWTIAGGTSGWVACPGSGTDGGGGIAFSYANSADYGKALLLHSQRPI